MKLLHYFLLFIIIGFGCSNYTDPLKPSILKNIEPKELKGSIFSSNLFTGRPFLLLVQQDNLFIRDTYEGKMITQVNLNNNNDYKRLASKGEGPNEFINIRNITFNSKKNCIGLLDGSTSRFSSYKIDKGELKINDQSISSSIRIEGQNIFDIISFNDGYIANGVFNGKQLCYFDKNGKAILEFGLFPGSKDGIENIETYFLKNQTMLVSSPNQEHFAVAGVYNDQLTFYQTSQSKPLKIKEYFTAESYLKTFNSKDGNTAQYGSTTTSETTYTYKSIYPTNNFLYVLYWGFSQKQLDQGKASSCYVLAFDWSGNIKKGYHIPDLLFNIAIDENRNYIYGLTYPLLDESILMKYKIQ